MLAKVCTQRVVKNQDLSPFNCDLSDEGLEVFEKEDLVSNIIQDTGPPQVLLFNGGAKPIDTGPLHA
jgi:hypothetical protein